MLVALMVVAFYFLILRPQRKRQQELQQTMRSIEPGARVMLSSGLFGTVVSVGEKQIVLEISPGAELTVLKQAIARVVGPDDEDAEEVDEDDEESAAAETPVQPAAEHPVDLSPKAVEPELPATDADPRTGSPTIKD
jgi:preprotein translocase subunit YajC